MTTTLIAPATDLSDVVELGRSLAGAPFINHSKLHVTYRSVIDHRHKDVSPQTGFDCSGFTGYAFREAAGIHLPRHVVEIFCATTEGYIGNVALTEVELNPDKFRPADILLFSRNRFWLPTHSAIYCGDGTIAHSAQRLGGVAISGLEEMLPWLIAARRVELQNA